MTTFASFVSDYLHIKKQISEDLEIDVSVIEKWASGEHNPHPLIKSAVWSYLCKQQMKDNGWGINRKDLIDKIEIVLRSHDPQGLIKMGAPSDEYQSEAEDVADRLIVADTVESLQTALWVVFAYSFSIRSAGAIKDYQTMAEEIWPLKEKHGKL